VLAQYRKQKASLADWASAMGVSVNDILKWDVPEGALTRHLVDEERVRRGDPQLRYTDSGESEAELEDGNFLLPEPEVKPAVDPPSSLSPLAGADAAVVGSMLNNLIFQVMSMGPVLEKLGSRLDLIEKKLDAGTSSQAPVRFDTETLENTILEVTTKMEQVEKLMEVTGKPMAQLLVAIGESMRETTKGAFLKKIEDALVTCYVSYDIQPGEEPGTKPTPQVKAS